MTKEERTSRVLEVCLALSAERDREALLSAILDTAMDVACCDAGTLYLLEDDGLHFCRMVTRSMFENRRGELIAAVLTIVVMYLLSMNFGRIETNRLFRAMAAVAIIAVGLVFMYARGMLDRYINTIVSLSSRKAGGIEEVGNGRIALWSLAIEKFFRSPIIGIGWNQFRATNDIPFMEGINVHNDYLQWLCETGIIGFILILIPTLYLWFKTAKRCRFLFANRAFYCNEARSYALISFGIQNFFILLHFMDPCFYKLIFWPIYALSIILYNRSTFFATRTAGALEQEYAYNCLIEEARAV